MKRRLISQRGSFTITLPKEWAEKNNLEPRQEIDISEDEGNLILSTERIQKSKEIDVKTNSSSELINRILLSNLYRLGYDSINVKINDKKQVNNIEKVLNKALPDAIITKSTEKMLKVEVLSKPDIEKRNKILRKVFHIISNLYSEIIEGNKNVDFQSDTTYQLTNLYRRSTILSKESKPETYFSWTLMTYLLLLQRSISKIKKKSKAIESIKNLFNNLETAFFKKEVEVVEKVIEESKLLNEKILNSKSFSKESHHLSEQCRLIELIGSQAIAILLIK